MAPLTRKEFYDLSFWCRDLALELARHDPHRVHPGLCRAFNQGIARLRACRVLRSHLGGLTEARPITRLHVLATGLGLWLVLHLFLVRWLGPWAGRVAATLFLGLLAMAFFVPESTYGTTVALLEGKLLRVVDGLESLLQSGEMEVTEAVYFRIKENLEEARRELRQQLYLAHGGPGRG